MLNQQLVFKASGYLFDAGFFCVLQNSQCCIEFFNMAAMLPLLSLLYWQSLKIVMDTQHGLDAIGVATATHAMLAS